MFLVRPDSSIEDRDGRVVYFSAARFYSDIVAGDCCFVCGISPKITEFNDEHVLPDWILRRFALQEREINIPNGTGMRYGQLKIPCCVKCNSQMGRTFEEPIREMFEKGIQSFSLQLEQEGPWLLFAWLCLIFLKIHLKDKFLRFNLDSRKGEFKIGDIYDWNELHHIHCMARSFYTGCDLDKSAMGSLVLLPAKMSSHFEKFDFADLYLAQTMLLRFDEIAILAVLNDSCAAGNLLSEMLQKLSAPLSPLQLRELLARMAFVNVNLDQRPEFYSDVDWLKEDYKIGARFPGAWSMKDWDNTAFGPLMYFACSNILDKTNISPETVEHIKAGRWTFLFDANGEFIPNSMEPSD